MSWKNNPIIFLIRMLWKYSKGNRHIVVLYCILFAIANAILLLEPLVIAKALNIAQTEGITKESLFSIISWLALLVVLAVGFWVFHGPARYFEISNAFRVKANYKEALLKGTMDLPMHWHTDHHSGDTIDKIEKGTEAMFQFTETGFLVIESIVRLVGSYIALVFFNVHASYLVIIMIIITVSIVMRFDKVIIPQYKELNHKDNEISAKIYDSLSNITTVIILRVEKLIEKAINKKIWKPFKLHKKNAAISETKWFSVTVCSSVMLFLIIASYIYTNVQSGTVILAGTIYVLYGYVERINGLFFRFTNRYSIILRQRTQVANAEEISNQFSKKKFPSYKLHKDWKELKIEKLSFSYHTEEGSNLHLKNVNLTIKRNKKIAFIGESGSGKTTILKIIRELYQPKKAVIHVDNRHLKQNFRSISADIALIPQDPEIFSTTIKENITLGVNHKISYIKKFTDLARFTHIVNRLPKKWNSSIVERGVNLSGGEKQRLALARGLLAAIDKQIILMDEPTSSVDLKNELTIYKSVIRGLKNKTIISSIHRLHLLYLFDEIYFFKKGRIIAQGSFNELLKNKEFQTLWKKYKKAQSSDKH